MNICSDCKKEIIGRHYNWDPELKKSIEYKPTKCSSCKRKEDPTYKYETEGRLLKDGIYDVTDIAYLSFSDMNWREPEKLEAIKEVQDFMQLWPDYVVAQAYETPNLFFFAKMPRKISEEVHKEGNWFNYGSCNLLTNCPQSILILAEND